MEKYFLLMSWTDKDIKYKSISHYNLDMNMLRELAPDPAKRPFAFCHYTRNILNNDLMVHSHPYLLTLSLEIDEKVSQEHCF